VFVVVVVVVVVAAVAIASFVLTLRWLLVVLHLCAGAGR